MSRRPICDACAYVRDHPIRFPTHLVHPEHGKPLVFDVRSEAVCPDCGTRWRRSNRDNSVVIVEG